MATIKSRIGKLTFRALAPRRSDTFMLTGRERQNELLYLKGKGARGYVVSGNAHDERRL